MERLIPPVAMNAVLWVAVYVATWRAYRLRAHDPQHYQRSTWAQFFTGVFQSPRYAAQFGASMTGGAAIGAFSAAVIRHFFATPGVQFLALLVFFSIVIAATWAYVQWRKRHQRRGTLR